MAKQVESYQYFDSIEQIYKARLGAFIKLARRHVYNPDLAIDVVHNALARSVKYFNDNPERKIREEVVRWLILKECKKMNKYSREIPVGDWFGVMKKYGDIYSE